MQSETPMITDTERRPSRVARMIACLLIMCSILATMPPPVALAERTGTVTATELNIRKSASSNGERLYTVKKGTKLTVLDTKGDWYRVRFGKVTGYVSKQYVSVSGSSSSSSSSSSNKTIASLGSAPKASKPGDKGSHVTKLQQALTIAGYYDGKVSGNYGELTEKAVRAFQKAKGLKQDGIAGSSTIKALFGSSTGASAGSGKSRTSPKTEKLDWFKDGKNVIPKDAVFTIKDVRSGRTFQARRWSGGNHIDAEPYSKSDTATMKKCYGGSWSWDRRPILIQYKGRVVAASMNGMPHSTHGNVKNNNFEGVFCIHLYKSKTHGTDRMDAQHQACVNEAAKASW